MATHDDPLNVSMIGKRERFSNEASQHGKDDIEHSVTSIYLELITKDSPFFSSRSSSVTLPEFEVKEVFLDQKLGQGEFGIVYSVGAFHIKEEEDGQSSRPESISELRASESSELQTDGHNQPSTPLRSKSPAVESAHGSSTGGSGTNQAANSESRSSPMVRTPQSKEGFGRKDSVVSFAENPVSVMLEAADKPTDDSSLSDDDDSVGLNLDGSDRVSPSNKVLGLNVSKSYMKSHVLRDGKARYAVKRVRRDLSGDKLFHAIGDMASEAHFLKSLRHPNICKMRGTISRPGKRDFGIILDRLTMTLRDRMLEWKKEDNSGSLFSKLERLLHHPQDKKEEELQVHKERYSEKLVALFDSARALRYLAKHSIIFRDLKPENLAFDYRGDLRLFDFGLAKELKEKDKTEDDKYNLTGMTGSRRYMAPEVIMSKYYGLPADVYSFAIMFWEVMSNNNAYNFLTFEKHFEMVVTRRKRPNLKKMIRHKDVLPEGSEIYKLVEDCWAHKPEQRPTIGSICDILAEEVKEISENESGSFIRAMDRTRHLVAQSIRSRAELQ